MNELAAWVTMYCYFSDGWKCVMCGKVGPMESLCFPVRV